MKQGWHERLYLFHCLSTVLSYPLRLSALLRMPCCMVMLLQVVDLAEVRARERGAAQDPRRQHLKYGYTSYPKLQFNVVNMFG